MSAINKAKLMDGRALAKRIRAEVAAKVERIRTATGVTPCLATVLVGNDPASVAYTRTKRKRCEEAHRQDRRIPLLGFANDDAEDQDATPTDNSQDGEHVAPRRPCRSERIGERHSAQPACRSLCRADGRPPP